MRLKIVFNIFFIYMGCLPLFGQPIVDTTVDYKKDSIAFFTEVSKYKKLFEQAEKENKQAQVQIFKEELISRLQRYNLYTETIEIVQRALQVALHNKDTSSIIECYRNIGMVYMSRNDYDKANRYINKSLYYLNHFPHYTRKIDLYQNKLRILLKLGSSDFPHYNELLRKQVNLEKNQDALVDVHNNYFGYYYQMYRNTQDERYKSYIRPSLDTALTVALTTQNWVKIATVYNNLAAYYEIIEKDIKKCIHYYRLAIEYGTKQPDSLDNLMYQSLTENYAYALYEDKQYQLAADYAMYSMSVLTEIYDNKLKEKVDELETRFQLNNQKKEFEKEQNEIKKRHRITNYFYIICIALLFIALILIYLFFQNRRLAQENRIQLLKREKQEEILVATMDAQNEERHRIATVLHDHVSALLASANMQLQAFAMRNEEVPKNISNAMKNLTVSHQKVRDLSHELVPLILTKFGLTKAIADLCESMSNENMNFECDSSLADKRYSSEFELKVYYMLSELMNNALRHSQASDVSIHMWEMNQELHLVVSDNGVGMTDEQRSNEDGIGMLQMRARINHLNGSIQIEDNEPGTRFEIVLPILD